MSIDIKDALAKATEIYSQNTPLRAAICSIPFVGPVIDSFIGTTASQIMQKRILNLVDKLKNEMSKLLEEKVEKDYLRSEEFIDLILRAFEYTVRTRNDEKIELYARILKGAVTIHNINEHFPEEYLEIIKELTPLEIKVAKAIYEQQSDYRPDADEINANELTWVENKGWSALPEKCGLSWEDFRLVLVRVAGTGLIKEIAGTYWSYSGGVYIITPLFKKIMKFIDE